MSTIAFPFSIAFQKSASAWHTCQRKSRSETLPQYGLAYTIFRFTGKARRLLCVGSTAGFGAGTGRSEAPPQPRPAHTARSFESNPDVPPHTCSVRVSRYAVMSPLGLRSDGEVVCDLSCSSCKRAAGYLVFKMDGVRAC